MHFAAIIWVFLSSLISASRSEDSEIEPLVIPASQYFEGNDGPWSTFDVRLGDPEQFVRVLVSTASPQTMVVLSEYGCSEDVFSDVPDDCAVSRGDLFNPDDSSTWLGAGDYGINADGVGLEANLGYEQNATFGLERMGVGLRGPSFDNQTVAGLATADHFYVGIFGLNNQPVNFTSLGNTSLPSYITSLKDNEEIPSLSWSYTAGAKYRLRQVYGQLIFSGYDTSRFEENSVSFTMGEDITRDLLVSLQSITYSGESSSTLLSEPIDIFVDSTDPNIWLPEDACDAFEEAFGLSLDDESGLYLINDTYHEELLDSNAEVSFRLSDVESGGDTVSITLPYAAFGLTAEYPLVEETSHYFPLKRANSSEQYTLGRVFLQEAYLSADYEHKVFNVSACVWNQGAEENIVAIPALGDGNGDDTDSGSPSSGQSSLSGGQIAGIVVGSVLGALLIAGLITVACLRNRRKWLKAGFAIAKPEPEPDESMLNGPAMFTSNHPSSSAANHGSAPMSAADVSAPKSTIGHSDSTNSSAVPWTTTTNTETPELDSREVYATQLKPAPVFGGSGNGSGSQIQGRTRSGRQVHELPGSEVEGGTPRTLGDGDSPPSPLVSTMDTTGMTGKTDSFVSPTSPTRTRGW